LIILSSLVPGFIPVSARDAPPNFRNTSPRVLQTNLARLRQTCRLDGEVAPNMSRNCEPPGPSVSSGRRCSPALPYLRIAQLGAPAVHGCTCRWYNHSWRTDSTPQVAGCTIAGKERAAEPEGQNRCLDGSCAGVTAPRRARRGWHRHQSIYSKFATLVES
jgi:hypothetical protein